MRLTMKRKTEIKVKPLSKLHETIEEEREGYIESMTLPAATDSIMTSYNDNEFACQQRLMGCDRFSNNSNSLLTTCHKARNTNLTTHLLIAKHTHSKQSHWHLNTSSRIPTSSWSISYIAWLLAVVIVLSCLCFKIPLTSALANCPNGCQCDDDTLVVKCGEGTLDVLPIALNPSIQRLIIKNNKIKTIDSSIQFYAELTFLDLSYNDLVTIPQRTFAFQRKLQELHLNHNKIGQINNKTLSGLSAVTVLNLRGNLLAELEDFTFAPLQKVEELNLGQNRINRIAPHAFDGLKNLRVLYLDDNTLTSVPAPENFRAMPLLAELYLGTNSFMSIPNKAFVDLKGLTRLDLKGAGLHNISSEAMKGLEGVRYLDLSDNRLQYIPQLSLSHLDRLEDLALGQNDFEVIPSNALIGLKNLKRLEITGAQRLRKLENSAFSTNTNLEYINLSTNKILSDIQENAFLGLPHLKYVILKENQIFTLNEGLFPWSDLITLDLSDNPLICDCRLLWLRSLLMSRNGTNEQIKGATCAAPPNLKGETLQSVTPAMLGCSHSDPKQQALIGILLVATAATITILALSIYACRRRIRELLKGGWGNSALGRKEREYQKTFSDEDYTARQPQIPCAMTSTAPYATTTSGYGQHAMSYMGTRPIPVTEL